ncbi:hypothetical protein ACJJTC_016843 [Scirpophaga incertulas]
MCDWLIRASEELISQGKGEAYCKLCHAALRAHKTDLEKHAKTKTHKEREKVLNVKIQPKLSAFGYSKGATTIEKSNDLQLAVYLAFHSSVRSVDHLDESTDVATVKYMPYMVRYYNEKNKTIMVDFLGFQTVYRATAMELCSAFKEFIKDMGLNINNLIAIGTDGANNLCGKNNSLLRT